MKAGEVWEQKTQFLLARLHPLDHCCPARTCRTRSFQGESETTALLKEQGPPHGQPELYVRCFSPQVALLLVVAGYQHLDSLADVSADGLRQHFEVNSIGPLIAVQALRPWLVSGTKARN